MINILDNNFSNDNELEYFVPVKINVRTGIEVAGSNIKLYMSPQDVLMEIGKPDKVQYSYPLYF